MLGEFFQTVTSGSDVVFWWVGDEENWKNVFCAFEDGKMVAKGQVDIIDMVPPGRSVDSKHTIYINLKTLPEREYDYDLLDKVYHCLYSRAKELKQSLSNEYRTILCIGNESDETANNKFFTERKGFRNLNSLYTMGRNLNCPIPEVSLTENLHFMLWELETTDEEHKYLELDAEVWPETPLGLKRLFEYKQFPLWITMVVREGDTVVGSLMVWKKGTYGFIENVFVRQPWRKRGIAKYLLAKALKYLKDNGLETAQLVVLTSNDSALSLYESVGFCKEKVEVRYYIDLS
ncbi:hypothetical protein J14TS2_32750 [Bacillus sp. J14TS2]|nr:hypothetical protein J14TS2_32750 [Bacillus sp. J14TS2]